MEYVLSLYVRGVAFHPFEETFGRTSSIRLRFRQTYAAEAGVSPVSRLDLSAASLTPRIARLSTSVSISKQYEGKGGVSALRLYWAGKRAGMDDAPVAEGTSQSNRNVQNDAIQVALKSQLDYERAIKLE